jgi:hypothetical protein
LIAEESSKTEVIGDFLEEGGLPRLACGLQQQKVGVCQYHFFLLLGLPFFEAKGLQNMLQVGEFPQLSGGWLPEKFGVRHLFLLPFHVFLCQIILIQLYNEFSLKSIEGKAGILLH